mmetsp:Transcript_12946/g.23435  ORF Transcript_12946/g.23435 Transcript_12946/m.23435 type:complete len:87 (-) Transcript_12946:92-352(-)
MAMDLLNVDDENPQDGSDDSDDIPSLEIWWNNEENAFVCVIHKVLKYFRLILISLPVKKCTMAVIGSTRRETTRHRHRTLPSSPTE